MLETVRWRGLKSSPARNGGVGGATNAGGLVGLNQTVTAIINNWGPYYVDRTKLVLDNKWTSTDTWGGLKSKLVVMAPYTNMPDDVKAMAQKTEAAIVAGTLHPFACPVIAQDGKTVECKGGTRLDNGQILSMNWYVKGIDDKLPQ